MKYKDLLNILQNMTRQQLNQEVQTIDTSDNLIDDTPPLKPILCVATVKELEIQKCRSSVDNMWHADEVVMLVGDNLFAKDGAIAYEWKDISSIDDIKNYPIYSVKHGKTFYKDQENPNPKNKDLLKYQEYILKNRMKRM